MGDQLYLFNNEQYRTEKQANRGYLEISQFVGTCRQLGNLGCIRTRILTEYGENINVATHKYKIRNGKIRAPLQNTVADEPFHIFAIDIEESFMPNKYCQHFRL